MKIKPKKVTYLCIKVEEVPLCWKAFLKNTTPHQQHWAGSVQVSPSNHLSAIGQRRPYAADVKMSFVPIQRKVNGSVKTVIVNALPDNTPHAVCPSTTLITCL